MTETEKIHKLLAIMEALRDPGSGCPWDLQQDFDSIAAWTLEEAYEVLDAIRSRDMTALRDELGDLLFQVVYHARMAAESGHFTFNDVVDSINDKLVRRHPHVFSDERVANADEQSRRWHDIKAEEKPGQTNTSAGLLNDVARNQPALRRAEKLQMKAATVGFDWDDLQPVFAKVREELDELSQEVEQGVDQSRIVEECGDLLFAMVNLARKLNVNPELALGQANDKFRERFGYIERRLENTGSSLDAATLQDMDHFWDEAKKNERQ